MKAELAKLSSDTHRSTSVLQESVVEVFWEVGRVGAEDDNQMEGFRPPCAGR